MNKQLVQQLISNYKTGFSLEQAFYINEEVFEAEWESIFKKHSEFPQILLT